MEPQNISTTRQLLRNIGSTQIQKYLTLPSQKAELSYAENCISNPLDPQNYHELLGIDCQMIETQNGMSIVKIIILQQNGVAIYDRWFNVGKQTVVLDYLTHITGINKQKLDEKVPLGECYGQKHIQEIQSLVSGKILVGHDLANDLKYLKIKHQAFIDTLALFPHNLGLPYKSKLRELALIYLGKYIQFNTHDPFEDAKTCLELVRDHVDNGRGTLQIEPFPEKQYLSNEEILKDAELDPSKILFFVLRGSQALGITINTPDYKSDYDYVVVYDTQTIINGKLIKLPNIDISFFDKTSYQRYLIEQNDVSYLELFFLPKQCMFVNTLKKPVIDMSILRESLGFHLNKAKMKQKRIMPETFLKPGLRWKILKTIHMRLRFIDNFLQLYTQYEKKIKNSPPDQDSMTLDEYDLDINHLKDVWEDISLQYNETGDFNKVLKNIEKIQKKMKTQLNQRFPKRKQLRCKGHQIGNHRASKNMRLHLREHAPRPHIQESSSSQYSHNKAHSSLKTVQLLRRKGPYQLQKYDIQIKTHRKYPNLLQLHYLQSASFSKIQARQCRGLIVDRSLNFRVIALPYFKFFDYNDPKNSQLKQFDFQSMKIYEKQDGSLAFLYYYDQQWHVASSTIPDGLNSYCFARRETTVDFKQQFWKIFHELGYKLPENEDKNKTFVFELMSKNHIIVVKREKNDLVLHGVRDIDTLKEEDHLSYEQKYNWRVAKPLNLQAKGIDDIVKKSKGLDPLKSEGFVLCDKNWTRIKVKSPGYVRINWLGQLNKGYNKDPKRYLLIEIVLSGEAQSFMDYCPQWAEVISGYLAKIKKLNKEIVEIFDSIKHLKRKQFAIEVRKYKKDMQSFLFAIRGRKSMYYGKVENVLNPKKFYKFITEYE